MQPIRVALVGLGNMGRHHCRALVLDPRFRLVAIMEPGEVKGPPELTTDVMPALARNLHELMTHEFDAAVVASPTETHAAVVKTLLEHGKHVLVEKPAAPTLVEANELVELAASRDLKLAVGHIERCNPAVDALQWVLKNHIIGMPVHAASLRCGGYPAAVRSGNQVFLDLAVHEFDVLVRLFEGIEVVDGFHHCLKQDDIPDLAEVRLSLPSGARATVHVNWLSPQKMRILRITGTLGVAELDYMAQTLKIYAADLTMLRHAEGGEFTEREHPFCEHAEVSVARGEPIRLQLGEFYKYLMGDTHNLCIGREILDSLRLLDDCLTRAGGGMSNREVAEWTAARRLTLN